MFYLKHRPTTLDHIVGHESSISKIRRIVATDRAAILLTGPSGCGKTTIALAICDLVDADREWGTIVLESRTAKLQQLVDLEAAISLRAFAGRSKLVLIDEAHPITAHGQDYCLGLLERLPRNVYIIATTTEDQPFSTPLRSRFHHIRLRRPTEDAVHKAMERIAEAENLTLPPLAHLENAIRDRDCNIRTCITELVEHGSIS